MACYHFSGRAEPSFLFESILTFQKNFESSPKKLAREFLPGSLGRVRWYYFCEAKRAIASLGCQGAMRAIASSISLCVSPWQGPTPIYCAATPEGTTTVQTYVSAAAKTLSTTKLMKGKSPQGSRVTVQIEQHLLCSAVQLTSCSSPAATASRLTSSRLPQVSLGASQLLKPASTTPRSYGRRYRSWHHGHVHATHNERRRVQRPVHHDQVNALRRGHRLGHHDQAPATHIERRRGKRPGRNDEVPATHNERRREQCAPPCTAASFEVNSEPHTGARPSVRLCVGPELARCVRFRCIGN